MINIIRYIEELIPVSNEWAEQLEEYADEHKIPIIDKISLQVLQQLVLMKQPKKILEIGTAIAYSTLMIHEIVPDSKIISLEKNDSMYKKALQNVERFKKNNNIEIIHGDALEIIERFPKCKSFDFVFIDAAKSQYERYFNAVDQLLNEKGIIVTDNVLFRKLVANSNEEIPKRYKTIVKNLRSFNEKVMSNKNYHSSLLPIGDGLLVSIKLK